MSTVCFTRRGVASHNNKQHPLWKTAVHHITLKQQTVQGDHDDLNLYAGGNLAPPILQICYKTSA